MKNIYKKNTPTNKPAPHATPLNEAQKQFINFMNEKQKMDFGKVDNVDMLNAFFRMKGQILAANVSERS